MEEGNVITSLLQQAIAHKSKSTVLKPLNWLLIILLSSTLSTSYFKLPSLITYILFGLFVLCVIVYVIVYVYCLQTDKDALRSETFVVQKMAIEKGIYGDKNSGVVVINSDADGVKMLGEENSKSDESKR